MRTRLITKQPPETFTEHATIVEQAESQAIEDRGFVNELLLQVKSDVLIMAVLVWRLLLRCSVVSCNNWYAAR